MKVETWSELDPEPCDTCGTGSHAWAFYYVLKRAGDKPWVTWNKDGTINVHRHRRETDGKVQEPA